RGELREGVARRGWREALPPIDSRDVSASDERSTLVLHTAQGPVRTQWIADDDAWRMSSLELPRPPFEPFARRLVDAWNGAESEAVVALCSAERAPSVRNALAETAARLKWGATRPALRDWSSHELESDRTELTASVDSAQIALTCRLGDGGRWLLE